MGPDRTHPTGALTEELADMAGQVVVGLAMGGVDTRRLTRAIRQQGAPHVALGPQP